MPSSEPVIFQLYVEPLQRFRLAAQGLTGESVPESHRARIQRYFDPLPFWYPAEEVGLPSPHRTERWGEGQGEGRLQAPGLSPPLTPTLSPQAGRGGKRSAYMWRRPHRRISQVVSISPVRGFLLSLRAMPAAANSSRMRSLSLKSFRLRASRRAAISAATLASSTAGAL